MDTWVPGLGLDEIARSLLKPHVHSTAYFLYDLQQEDYLVLLSLMKAELSIHPDANQVNILPKPWERAFNIEFYWKPETTDQQRQTVDQRVRDLAVQYNAVLDQQDELEL